MTLVSAAIDEMLETVATETGLDDFGDPSFRDGLERVWESGTTQAGLTPLGLGVLDGRHRPGRPRRGVEHAGGALVADLRPVEPGQLAACGGMAGLSVGEQLAGLPRRFPNTLHQPLAEQIRQIRRSQLRWAWARISSARSR